MPGIKTYFRCMFRALRDIHARGMIHRDVKPANFLFDPRTGLGTLCDFGLACVSLIPHFFLFAPVYTHEPHVSGLSQGKHRVPAYTLPPHASSLTVDYATEQSMTLPRSRKCRRRRERRVRGPARRLGTRIKILGL